jgi:hypothetical protein
MGSGHNTKRATSLVAFIEMEPKRQYILEQGHRRLNEQFALLFGPTLTSGNVYALGDRNAQVLVKGDQPVILNRL